MPRRKTTRTVRPQPRGIRYGVRFSLRLQPGFFRGSILVTITHSSKRIRVALGHTYVSPEDWDAERQCMKGSGLHALGVNEELEALRKTIGDYFERTHPREEPPTLAGLQAEVFPKRNVPDRANESGISMLFRRFMGSHTHGGRPVTTSTQLSYGVVLNAWQAFEDHLGMALDVSAFRAVSAMQDKRARTALERFDRFLAEHGPTGSPLADNSRAKYLKIFSTFLRWAERETGMPLLRGINTGGEIVARGTFSLTEAEREAIEAVELAEGTRMHHVRNAMVMALYTGLRFSEWRSVNPGLWREASQPVTMPKTGRTALVVHRAPVRRVLKEYAESGWPDVLKHNSKVNEAMKVIAERAGLTRPVTVTYAFDGRDRSELVPLHAAISTHTLRRTKVTLALDAGESLRDVCLETGQDEATARKHYDRPDTASHVRRLGVERISEGGEA